MSEGKLPEEQTLKERAAQLPFDEALVAKFNDTIQRALTDHPELRSVAVVFDYTGNLNEAPIKAGIWKGEDGHVVGAGAIIGSIQQMLKVLGQQFVRVQGLEQGMREELTIIGQELVKRKKELEANEQQEGGPD